MLKISIFKLQQPKHPGSGSTLTKTDMTGWKIHHENGEFPIEHEDFLCHAVSFQGSKGGNLPKDFAPWNYLIQHLKIDAWKKKQQLAWLKDAMVHGSWFISFFRLVYSFFCLVSGFRARESPKHSRSRLSHRRIFFVLPKNPWVFSHWIFVVSAPESLSTACQNAGSLPTHRSIWGSSVVVRVDFHPRMGESGWETR